jgi:hypothetical protein
MNIVLGSVFVVLGLFFAPQVPSILGLLPVWGLAAFLAYAGLRHAALIADMRGADLVAAAGAGALGAYAGNLAVTVAIALAVEGVRRITRRAAAGRRAPARSS